LKINNVLLVIKSVLDYNGKGRRLKKVGGDLET